MNEVPEWAARLRRERLRPDRMWSLTRMAHELIRAAAGRVPTSHPASLRRQIRRWESGENYPIEAYRVLYSRAFGLDPRELFASPSPIMEYMEQSDKSRVGVGGARQTADEIRDTSARIVALDIRVGAGDMVDTVVRVAAHAHRAAHASADRDVLAAAAEAQQIAGWVAFDGDRQDLARRMSLEALLTARAAGDRQMEYFVLGQLAMQDLHLQQPAEASQICDAALSESSVQGSVRTMFHMRAARAAAQMGEYSRARSLIGQTRACYLDGPRAGDPAWAWWLTEGEISWHHAMICVDAGQWGRAVELFAVAAEAEVAAGYDRGASVSHASLLWALAHVRDWAEAETVLTRDVAPRRGLASSARADRLLVDAARLLDAARERPSLRAAARQLLAGP
ncbi:DNA-binding protein [Nonomuraea longicatena]|uniref:XRE family transcriptional regulator n=1 Tax=Nonomuraea longicatena TaxID=83682 RepID=A0ABN1NW75_9ACTN